MGIESTQKAGPPFRAGQGTLIMFAEPLVPMIGDKAVGGVTKGTWDDLEDFGQAPGETEMAGDLQGGVALMKHTLGTDEEHGVGLFRVQPVLAVELAAGLGLNGAEMNAPLGVMLQDELHGPIA